MIYNITFSPTGGTRRAGDILCKAIGQPTATTELCLPVSELTFPNINEDDFVVISMPVYGGRVPSLAVERLRQIKPSGAKCAVVAVYGNRAFDDALLEMQDVATAMGFRVIAAVGAIAEHSIVRKYGASRPDADDEKVLSGFGERIAKKMAAGDCSSPAVPGNHPYKKAMAGPHPTAGSRCNACGLCAKKCPVGAISPDSIRKVDKKKCISCMRCVADCPHHARSIGMIMNFLVTQALKKPCASRKGNEIFF